MVKQTNTCSNPAKPNKKKQTQTHASRNTHTHTNVSTYTANNQSIQSYKIILQDLQDNSPMIQTSQNSAKQNAKPNVPFKETINKPNMKVEPIESSINHSSIYLSFKIYIKEKNKTVIVKASKPKHPTERKPPNVTK